MDQHDRAMMEITVVRAATVTEMRVECGVLMYAKYTELSHHLGVLMSESGMPCKAIVVAARIRKTVTGIHTRVNSALRQYLTDGRHKSLSN